MNFYRIEHISKACQNLETTLQFYQTLFPDWFIRAQETQEESDDLSRWIHFGNHQFYIALYASQSVPSNTGNIDHVGLVIEDGKRMEALLEANGIKYFVEDAPETKYRIYVKDPDSTLLELVEYNEGYELR